MRESLRTPLICLLLAGTTLAVFWGITHNEFVVYDDRSYVVANPNVQHGLTGAALWWAFTSFESSNWHPLTWISHILDCRFFGLNPTGHHLTNLALHVANTLLLFLFLKRVTSAFWRSSLVAALFALHPLHVESVAWVAERKDVLSGFFFVLTLGAYVRYVDLARIKDAATSSRASNFIGWVWYGTALLLFACGLMSKPMLVTLPFVLLLVDLWPLQRFSLSNLTFKRSDDDPQASSGFQSRSWPELKRLLIEKLPFVALAAASSWVTFVAQERGGSVESLAQVPFGARLTNAVMACSGYLQKMAWPSKLAVAYLPPEHWPAWHVGLALAALTAITALVLVLGRRSGWLITSWFWYLITLVPIIGLVQVGVQYMADRYTYLPSIGIFIMFSWGAAVLVSKYAVPRGMVLCLASLLLAALVVSTRRQITFWRDSETLFQHCLQVTTNNYLAHTDLGAALMLKGDFEGARVQLRKALELRPSDRIALNNLGVLLAEHGDLNEAAQCLHKAGAGTLEDVYLRTGIELDGKGKTERAMFCYRECLRLNPERLEALNNLAWVLATNRDPRFRDGREAVRLAERACELTRHQAAVFVGTLAAAYAEAGQFSEAISAGENAVSLAAARGQRDLEARNAQLLNLYRARKAYHENPAEPDVK